jgi:hypothetical protein
VSHDTLRGAAQVINEMPRYRMGYDFGKEQKGDLVLPDVPKIVVPGHDNREFYKLLKPFRYCETSLLPDRFIQFVSTLKQPGDEIYLVSRNSGMDN